MKFMVAPATRMISRFQTLALPKARGRLILTGDQKFPFYYPSVRDMELIVFKTDHFL